MNRLLMALPLLLILLYTAATAQETTAPARPYAKKHELGLSTELKNSNMNDISFVGLQFKKWKNEHYGIRALLGRAELISTDFPPVLEQVGGMIYRKQPLSTGKLTFAGIGLEARRKLYKAIHVFAAVEVKAGYGKAVVDTILEGMIDGTVQARLMPPATPGWHPVGTMFYAGLTPAVGVNILFRRFSFGTELGLNYLTYSSARYDNQPVKKTIREDMGNFNPRFFLHYRL